MDAYLLTLYKPPFEKIRVGKNNDGGYIICNIPSNSYDCLISAGISDDTSFEDEFLLKYNDIMCYGFDGTITKCPSLNKRFIFTQKNISTENTSKLENLHSLLSSHSKIFLKLDIEREEFAWFPSLTSDHMNNILQMTVEFHFPVTSMHADVFRKINKTHVLVHIHGNNCCGYVEHNGISAPNVFECTYLHKSLVPELILNDEPLPISIDQPNIKSSSDIRLTWSPFVNKLS
jgi:hypothetical protein